MERSIQASRFKAQCLALLDEVERDHVSLVVTKHGRPIARLVPLAEGDERSLAGSVRLVVREDEAYYSTSDEWEAEDVVS
ncbi:MAG TPA: type II toxin-antitoxin system Phd/YefM family antitoxin [Candidatus Limnocylindrales bacterium]|nr:type II toxin-antitoxin system Phd/YefM family antitoxin [Candidatus Limnocylindrales bacterium]